MRLYADHSRDWRRNSYVYPVVSRRSQGVSIGVNLNPDTACNFDCIYCQVDRSGSPRVRKVVPQVVADELDQMASLAIDGRLFKDDQFSETPAPLRRINDIAFSGDGEPTTCPVFAECVQIAADVKARHELESVKIVLITDSCYLTRREVVRGLEIMDANNGEIWAKLDAGTEAYFERVNRPNFTLRHVIENIIAAARIRPVCIQSMWMRLEGQSPPPGEIAAFIDRLGEITAAGGKIKKVQLYTVARRPAESCVEAIDSDELATIEAQVASRTGLRTETYPAAG